MLRTYTLVILTALWAMASAQTVAFKDPKTNITFQQYTSDNGFSFGIALPEASSTGFIGQISAGTRGWAAVSLTGSMTDGVVVVAWPNGDEVVSSLRTTKTNVGAGTVLTTISAGTVVNKTGFTYTFLCEGCVINGKTMGFALSNTAPANPSMAKSSIKLLGGSGTFDIDTNAAKSAAFTDWAAQANDSNASVVKREAEAAKFKAGPGVSRSGVSHLSAQKREAVAKAFKLLRPISAVFRSGVSYRPAQKRDAEAEPRRPINRGGWSIMYRKRGVELEK